MSIQVTRSSMPKFEEYINEIRDLWDSHWLTNMGSKHKALELQLLKFLKVPNITLFTNGHLALEYIIEAMNLKGEVITTPFTFASTTHAIVRNGLKPVFCDINKDNYTIDVTKIEQLITEETSAIIPVHVYGNVCDVDVIDQIAKRYNLKVIYDAAHTFGVEIDGEGVGSFGDASMFSFHATKVFHTIEGGALTYNDPDLSKPLNALKNFGITKPDVIQYAGGNAKLNEFQAAMGICNLRNVNEEIKKRGRVVARYKENLLGIKGLKMVESPSNVTENYAYFPVVFEKFSKTRDEVFELLLKNDIVSRKYFYPLTSQFDCYRNIFSKQETPIARYIASNVLTLPLYSELDMTDVDIICKLILS